MALTGTAATEALQVYMRLGASNSRFSAAKVGAAVRTRAGRARLLGAGLLKRVLRPAERLRAPRRGRDRSTARRASGARTAPPGRPALTRRLP